MEHIDDASDRPVPESPVQFTTSSFGFPDGSGSDLDGMGTRLGITEDEKLDAILSKICTLRSAARAIFYSLELDVSSGITRHKYTWRICG